MALRKRNWGIFIFAIILGALLGSALSEIIAFLLPQGVVKDFFVKSVPVGIQPPGTINIVVLTLTLGFTIKFNILSLLGVLLIVYLLK